MRRGAGDEVAAEHQRADDGYGDQGGNRPRQEDARSAEAKEGGEKRVFRQARHDVLDRHQCRSARRDEDSVLHGEDRPDRNRQGEAHGQRQVASVDHTPSPCHPDDHHREPEGRAHSERDGVGASHQGPLGLAGAGQEPADRGREVALGHEGQGDEQ